MVYSCSTPLLWCVDAWVATLWLKGPVSFDKGEVYSERQCIVISKPLHFEEKFNTYGIKLLWHLYISYLCKRGPIWRIYLDLSVFFSFVRHLAALHHRWDRERSRDWKSASQVRQEHHLHLLMGEVSADFRNWTKQEIIWIICIHVWPVMTQCQSFHWRRPTWTIHQLAILNVSCASCMFDVFS